MSVTRRRPLSNILTVTEKIKNHVRVQSIGSVFFTGCELLYIVNFVLVELRKCVSPQFVK